jgi:hypothetical protein
VSRAVERGQLGVEETSDLGRGHAGEDEVTTQVEAAPSRAPRHLSQDHAVQEHVYALWFKV